MKTLNTLLRGGIALLFLVGVNAFSQENTEEKFQPVYLTITTAHWNPDPNVDFSDWMKTEKEYFDKVTMKNDLIIGSGYYTHFFTPDNSEIVFVNVYKSWDDIEKANEKSNELVKAAWPDEKARKDFFDNQGKYYSPYHSDEIYMSTPYSIELKENSETPQYVYVRHNEMALSGESKPELMKEYFEKVTKKLPLVKAYYSHRHLWGSDSREFSEAYFYDNFADIEKTFEDTERIEKETWPDEAKRKDFMKERGKMFTGKHADYIYKTVPGLMK